MKRNGIYVYDTLHVDSVCSHDLQVAPRAALLTFAVHDPQNVCPQTLQLCCEIIVDHINNIIL